MTPNQIFEIVSPTEEETTNNLRPCAHGDPCEKCFVTRTMGTMKAKFSDASGGKKIPRWIAEQLREACKLGFRAEESWYAWVYDHRN